MDSAPPFEPPLEPENTLESFRDQMRAVAQRAAEYGVFSLCIFHEREMLGSVDHLDYFSTGGYYAALGASTYVHQHLLHSGGMDVKFGDEKEDV